MGDKRGNSNLGEQILNAVDDILESGNFDKLNSVVSDTVSKALEETRKQLEQITSGQSYGKYSPTGQSSGKYSSSEQSSQYERSQSSRYERSQVSRTATTGKFSSQASKQAATSASGTTASRSMNAKPVSDTAVRTQARTGQTYSRALTVPRVRLKKVGGVSGVLFRVFGGIGTVFFGFLFLIAITSDFSEGQYWQMVMIMGILLAGFISLMYVGVGRSARLKRAQRYVQVMQGKTYINISDLALLTNKSPAYIRRDVKKMIQCGIFPEGHLDIPEQCLIMGDVAYGEYIRLEKSRMALRAEEEQKRLEAHEAKEAAELEAARTAKEAADRKREEAKDKPTQSVNPELEAMIQEGRDHIKKLRDLNDAIEGEVISGKLFYLENILKEIFEQLKEHPEQMPEMHKFMDYYLPTTLKLVTAYEEFDRVSVQGEDIVSAKREIEKTLDTINTAFAELLNKLFRDRAFDAATDAQVLKTMLEREGLTKQPIFASRPTVKEEAKLEKMLK
ncbi:MAG: 5-bromo-4-chloroindolyl phosphate hydrolysis family protein [Lachnospiraceae bacterium]|nr:5-bromo-4-chloroindolyl phosphate hydrolysis family protein [Lachnospiraceae bacterium]